jgi:hypothetical protein
MMRVLALVTYRIFPTLMGGQKGVALFYQHLQKHVQVVLALSNDNVLSGTDAIDAKKALHRNRLIFLNYFRIGVLKKLIRQQNVRLLIAEHSYAGWIGWLLRRRTGLPFIIHSHNLEALRFKQMRRWWWPLYWHYEKWIHQKADFNFFISYEDRAYAIQNFHLKAEICATITYGVAPFQKSCVSRADFLQSVGLHESCNILFFNGTLDYEPNHEAVLALGREVAPRLNAQARLFKILISGNRIPARLKRFIEAQQHLQYLDYLPDVAVAYQAAQLFINPIRNNSGVKTKVIEAIANHCTVVSTASGAAGIYTRTCGSKLITVADEDWDGFADRIAEQLQKPPEPTPAFFFDTYLWDAIAKKAAAEIAGVVMQHAAN